MRLKEKFLDIPSDVALTLERVAEHCKPFIKDIKKMKGKKYRFLYRGMIGPRKDAQLYTTRKDRRPRDSDPRWHKDFGAGSVRKFGINIREQTVFTSFIPIYQYGIPYFVFPLYNYKCIWSSYVDDLAEWQPYVLYAQFDDDDLPKEKVQKSIDKHVDKMMKTYNKGTVAQASKGIVSGNGAIKTEVSLVCDQYYALKRDIYDKYLNRWLDSL